MPIKPLANHGYPSGYGLFTHKNAKYIYTRDITVTNTTYFINYSDNYTSLNSNQYAQIMTNKYDPMGITKYYVKVRSVIHHYDENEKKYKEKQKKKKNKRLLKLKVKA